MERGHTLQGLMEGNWLVILCGEVLDNIYCVCICICI